MSVARHLGRQAAACRRLGSGLYAGLLERAAEDVEAGGPARELLHPFEGWADGSAYGLRFMGAVNRLVVSGAAPELEPHFAPGGDAAAAWPAFRALLEDRGGEVSDLALRYAVQTNEVGRCAALAPGFLALSEGRPLRLLEIGASAGLNLRWDRYRYEDLWGDPASPVRLRDRYEGAPPAFEPQHVEVVDRRGCDPEPVDAASDEGALTLTSFVWPDQADRVDLLRGAIEVARRVPAAVEQAPAGEWLERVLAAPAPDGATTVVFHSIVWQYLGADERDRIRRAIERAARDAPVAWLRMESDGADARIDVTTWPDGEERLVARAGYHGRPVRWMA